VPDAPRSTALRAATGSLVGEIVRLYGQGLSTRRIGEAIGMDRQAITRILRKSGVAVAPRGAGRARSTARLAAQPAIDDRIRDLYLAQRMSRAEVATALGLSESEVRSRMRASGIPTRTRGQANREDRRHLDPEELENLYLRDDLTAEQVGAELKASRHIVLRAAHELGLPVRMGGAERVRKGPTDIELIEALYGDPLVADAVERHRLPVRGPESPIEARFPEPVPLTAELLADLYEGCGLSALHIELLTGQPAATVRHRLRSANIGLRPPGGRSPFRLRWRHDQTGLRRRVHTHQRPMGVDQDELDGTGIIEVVSSESTIQPAT